MIIFGADYCSLAESIKQAFLFFVFFYSLLSHPNTCVFAEKSTRKTIWSDADEELRREIHEEDDLVWCWRRLGSLWCTLPSINPFHPLPQFHSSPTHDSTPWNLKWMVVGNWNTLNFTNYHRVINCFWIEEGRMVIPGWSRGLCLRLNSNLLQYRSNTVCIT